jgi:hypothetical protein
MISFWKRLASASGLVIGTAFCTTMNMSSLPPCPTACGAQQFCEHGVLPGSCPVIGNDDASDAVVSDASMSDAGTVDAGPCQPGCPGCGPFVDTPACAPLPTCSDTTVCECLIATCGACGGQCGLNNGEYELQCNGC